MVLRSTLSAATQALQTASGTAIASVVQATEMATSVKEKVVGTSVYAYDTVIDAKNSIVDSVVDTKNAVVDTVALATDTAVTFTKDVITLGVNIAVVAGSVGLIVAAITAPVPVIIGLFVIEIMTIIHAFKPDTIGEVEMRAIKRHNARLIEKLSRYGAIPATSLIETPNANFRLDMNAGTISGTIKSGLFSSRDIQTMSVNELKTFAAATDKETRSLIEAYLKFREAQAAVAA
jgi:hypothetical protein